MDLFNTITPHTTLLTPNRRLAAVILKKYSAWQLAAGKTCWPSLDILPLYPSWLERMWQQLTTREMNENTVLLTTQQENILWEKILREAPENESLLQLSDTAKMAKSAWETLKRWQINLNEPMLHLTEDSRAFLNWATTFQILITQKKWLDQNSLADHLAEKMLSHSDLVPKQLILIGFTEVAPQYQHLLNQCQQQGCEITHYTMPTRNQTVNRIELTDTETEIQTMALWAKSHLAHAQSIGCIIPNLETIREQVIRIFSSVLKPDEFNISAGKPLIQYPIIHDAFQLLQLTKQTLTLPAFSRILRSPFVGDAERERYKRALFDVRLHNSNTTVISLAQLIDPQSRLNLTNLCPALTKRLTQFNDYLQLNNPKKLLPINQWVTIFTDLLNLLGWPGERSLNSHEYQVVQNAWLPLLNNYTAFANIIDPINYHDALRYLTRLATDSVFQPESPDTSLQILGILEAADLPFEQSWVMGLDDSTWPPRPKPNPFIPLRLQKTANMPNASADRELQYCQTLTKQLQQSSEHILFSHSLQKEDTELRPSTLLKEFPAITSAQLIQEKFFSLAEQVFTTQDLLSFEDEIAPPIATDVVLGGVKIFKTQAECPFKAFSELRLHAKKIEEPTIGLRKLDRGNLIHKALELLWSELKDSTTLAFKSTDELQHLIHTCSEQALQDIVDVNTSANKRYLALEIQRLEKLLGDWITIEKARPPFKVLALEAEITATIGKITANFRIDRIDELTTETTLQKQLIIDYKTGKYIDRNGWFGERLEEPQLPIYCLVNPDEIVGIAFAKINPDKMGMVGASRTPLHFAAISPLADAAQADASLWPEQLNHWRQNIEKLGEDFYQGKADVNPKDPNINCRLCGLQALCRIHELTFTDENDDTLE